MLVGRLKTLNHAKAQSIVWRPVNLALFRGADWSSKSPQKRAFAFLESKRVGLGQKFCRPDNLRADVLDGIRDIGKKLQENRSLTRVSPLETKIEGLQ